MKHVRKIVGATLLTTLALAGEAAAQVSTTTPGIPNTGVGGGSTEMMVLLGIAFLAAASVGYLYARSRGMQA
ncbi:hypothetical protein HY969_04550 [Candidatus Kaiserbacteria bacterium]|nr:hypothetical protein [Candidatus Kaiserbacteria bacterium]